jgi:hypothetical protein
MNIVLYFVVGTTLSLIVWCIQRPRWSILLKVLCCTTLLAFTGIFVFLESAPKTLGKEEWYTIGPYPDLSFFVLMLIGMAARYFTKAIEVRREKIAALERAGEAFTKPGIAFDLWEFSYPLFVSVVTFGALLTQVKGNGLSLENIILSFQTGFFWQTLLATRQGKS